MEEGLTSEHRAGGLVFTDMVEEEGADMVSRIYHARLSAEVVLYPKLFDTTGGRWYCA